MTDTDSMVFFIDTCSTGVRLVAAEAHARPPTCDLEIRDPDPTHAMPVAVLFFLEFSWSSLLSFPPQFTHCPVFFPPQFTIPYNSVALLFCVSLSGSLLRRDT